jgi:hypothetical protein
MCALLLLAVCAVGCGARSGARGGSRTVVRTYSDGQGRTVYLRLGKGTGHRGDWGWLHIKTKHIEGIWKDGGVVTTFPQAFGTRSDAQVQELIGKALTTLPRPQGSRSLYRWRGGGWSVLVVVGADGTIITSYPQRS